MRKVRVASAQFFSGTDVGVNLDLCRRFIGAAADAEAELLVLPENSNRVRDYPDRETCFALAELMDGPFVTGIREAARSRGIHVVVNADLRGTESPDVFITSLLVDDRGDIVGRHRKHILWDYEYMLFKPGADEFAAFDTRLGRLGMICCADGLIPEPARCVALAGAELLLNSLNSRGPDEMRVHVPLRAIENACWMVSANTVGGPPDGWPWMGGSQVVSPTGEVVVRASEDKAELIIADIDLDETASARADPMAPFNRRRPHLYGALGEPDMPLERLCAGPRPTVSAALLQVSLFHNPDWTVLRAERQIAYAASRGAQVGVLPELFCFDPAAVAVDPRTAAGLSIKALERIRGAARNASLAVAVSLVESEGGEFYHTAYLVGPDGALIARYRKSHLGAVEVGWAKAGDELNVFDTPFGRVGLMIGDETWVPEVARLLALEGAELILHPCNWSKREEAEIAATERVEENRVHLVSTTRFESVVGSQVVVANPYFPDAPIGLMRYPMAHTIRPGFEELLVMSLDLEDAHSKLLGRHLDVFGRRNPPLYRGMWADTR